MKRINMQIDDDMLERIDTFAKKYGLSRSSAIIMLSMEALDAKEGINSLTELQRMLEELKKTAIEGAVK